MKILPIIHLCLFLGTIYIAASDRAGEFYNILNINYTPADQIIDLDRNLKIQLPGSYRFIDLNPEGDQDIFAVDFFYNLLDGDREIKIARTNRGPSEQYYVADSLQGYLQRARQELLDDPYRFRQTFIPKDPATGLPITNITEFILRAPGGKLVKLQHGEAQKPDILISEAAVKESATLKNMLEDIKADEALLPLMAYSYDLVFNFADLLKLINKNRSKTDIEIKQILVNKLSAKITQELVDLANFTNFLDIPILLDVLLNLLGKKASENKFDFYTIITGLQESNLIENLVNNFGYSLSNQITDRKYFYPSISADGSSIIARGLMDNYLYLFKDGPVTKLVDSSNINRQYNYPSISADGSSIIAIGSGNYLYLFKDGAATKLVDSSNINRQYSYPSISADGSSIIARGLMDNYLYLFKDGPVTKLVDSSNINRQYNSPSISADGSSIIARGLNDYLYLFKDGAVTKLEDPSDTNRKYNTPSISADGSSIITRGSMDNYLYLFKDGAVTKLVDPSDTTRRYYYPSISADGSSIIARGPMDNYLYLFKDGAATKLVDSSNINRQYSYPSISADGSSIIAMGLMDNYLYLFKDGPVTKLVDPSDINRKYDTPSISADGSSIIARGSDDNYLYLFTRQATLKKFISQLDGPEQKIVKEILETATRE